MSDHVTINLIHREVVGVNIIPFSNCHTSLQTSRFVDIGEGCAFPGCIDGHIIGAALGLADRPPS
jgi:hypothetical protein